MPCVEHKDGDGHHWIVPADKPIASVDVWWNRTAHQFRGKTLRTEQLVIRQMRDDDERADVLVLTFGQVYDLIDALNKAVEHA